MLINEDNIFSHLDSLKNSSAYEMYLSVKEGINKSLQENKYSSIETNFMPMLTFYLIQKKYPLDDFKDFLDILNKNHEHDYKYIFSRFFGTEVSPRQLDRYKTLEFNRNKIWDSMSCVFLKEGAYNCFALDDINLPYLEVMISSLNDKNIEFFHSNGFGKFLVDIINDKESFNMMIDLSNKYEILNESVYLRYRSLPEDLMNILSHRSYLDKDASDEDNLKMVEYIKDRMNYLKDNLNNFDVFFSRFLFEQKPDAIILSPSMKGLNLFCVSKMDFLSKMDEKVKSFIKDIENSQEFKNNEFKMNDRSSFVRNSAIREMGKMKADGITNTSITMDIGLEKRDYYLDKNFLERIDVNSDLYSNLIPLKILSIMTSKGELSELAIPEKIFKYIEDNIESESEKDEFHRFDLVNLESLQKGLNYLVLDKKTQKSVESKRVFKKI